MYLYEIENREIRTQEILKALGKKEYGNAERQCVNRVKKGLQSFIKKQRYM